MDELIRNLALQLRGMWSHRWMGLLVAWLVGVVGAAMVLLIPDKYEASARVYVDTQSVLKPLMSGLAVQPNVEQQIVILSRTLISRPNIERLIRMADLDLNVADANERAQLIDQLMKTLELKSVGRDNLFTVGFQDADPQRAKRVVQALMTIFVESGLTDKRRDNQSAQQFLDEQIKGYAKRLEDAETRLKEFKLRNMNAGLELGTRDSFARMAELSAQLNAARLELREAEQSRDALSRQLAGEEPVLVPDSPESLARMSVPEIDARIDLQKRALDAYLQRYTDEHPDVLGTRRIIEQLEDQRRKDLLARKDTPAAKSGLNGNPVWQQLKVSLGETEAQVASLRARVAEFDSRMQQIRHTAQLMPEVESEMMQLMRDYEVHKRNYDALVSRRESASMAGNMEASNGLADFRVIDPPSVSSRPVAPNRPVLGGVALLVALAAGVAASFVLSQARPMVFDVAGLARATSLPVLGAVTQLDDSSRNTRRRRGYALFAGGVTALLSAFGGLIALLMLTARAV